MQANWSSNPFVEPCVFMHHAIRVNHTEIRCQKAKVRWLDGEYEGLEEWVPKIRLLEPWEEAEALLEDERRMLAAVAASEEDGSDEVEWEAVEKVFGTLSRTSDPSQELILGYNAVEENLLAIQNLDAAARRLGL